MTYDEVMENQPLLTLNRVLAEIENHGIEWQQDIDEGIEYCKVADGYRGDLLLEWLGY